MIVVCLLSSDPGFSVHTLHLTGLASTIAFWNVYQEVATEWRRCGFGFWGIGGSHGLDEGIFG